MVDGKQPALSLLKAYGIPLSKVKLVVATHWHTDHIRGLTEVVSSCQAAEVYSYSALFSRELLAFASGTIDAIAKSCVKELEGMLYALDNRQLRYATVGRQIWSREDEACAAAVWSLAPTDSDVEAALDNVLRRLRRVGGGGLKPNEVSIPLVVTLGSSALLLGADYEPEKKSGGPRLTLRGGIPSGARFIRSRITAPRRPTPRSCGKSYYSPARCASSHPFETAGPDSRILR